ncbi:hypothetical protein MLD38_031210 [Melastoma candidum]|uniref:Uncharacterized protein n=1 Tax=Melastoma candidum TaxID=119954 RepID=A0ACB9MSJ8_9MYRT|nr:hypothetical protein MLD38_031210 [Melastoma candidum]
MSNQPLPSRPWLRLGSITRPVVPPTVATAPLQATPAPTPVPSPPSPTTPLLRPSLHLPTPVGQVAEPRLPPLVRSPSMALMATRSQQPKEPTLLPNASKVTPAASAGSLVPSSVIQKPAATTEALPAGIKPLNETPPHKTVPSALLSPRTPLPSQINAPEEDVPPSEAERKNTLFQKITTFPEQNPGNVGMIRPAGAQKTGPAAVVENGPIEGAADMVKKKPGTRHMGVQVITIAGENRGATMELTGVVINHPEKTGNRLSSSHEGMHGTKERGHKENAAATTFRRLAVRVNSNVQGVNNSYCNHRDPGVHMTLTRMPKDGGFLHTKYHKA